VIADETDGHQYSYNNNIIIIIIRREYRHIRKVGTYEIQYRFDEKYKNKLWRFASMPKSRKYTAESLRYIMVIILIFSRTEPQDDRVKIISSVVGYLL